MLATSLRQVSGPVTHVGANIYYWGEEEARSLLVEGLGPWAREVRERGLAHHFWWTRFDARGPHLFTVFSTSPDKETELQRFLNHSINEFLRESPSTVALPAEVLEQRHLGCRGAMMCLGDKPEGLAENNSFLLFSHANENYPMSLGIDMADSTDFWQHLDQLAFWAIQQAQSDIVPAGVQWFAAVDHALQRHGISPENYWCFHLSTLFVYPNQKNWRDRRDDFKSWLPRALSDHNRNLFSRLWMPQDTNQTLDVDVDGLVGATLANDGRTLDRRFMVLRQINHQLLLQIGLFAKFEIPLVLYAWYRALSARP